MNPSPVSAYVPPPPQTRRIRWMFLSLLLSQAIVGPRADAQDRVIQISNGAVMPGQSIQIALNLSKLTDFAGGDFVLSYDPRWVTIQDVDRTDSTDDFLIAHGTPGPGLFTISMAAAEGLTDPDSGTIALLTIQSSVAALEESLIPITFHEARWYDESSVRHEFFGDNGLIRIGTFPPEEVPLSLSLASATAEADQRVDIAFTVSLPEAIGKISGDLSFDPSILTEVDFQSATRLDSWQIHLTPLSGKTHFEFTGPIELSGVVPLPLGDWRIRVANTVTSEISSDLLLENLRIENLEGLAFEVIAVDGQIDVAEGPETPTPTEPPTPSPTPTPTESPPPHIPVDFDSNGEVDERDLVRFLEIWKQEAKQ